MRLRPSASPRRICCAWGSSMRSCPSRRAEHKPTTNARRRCWIPHWSARSYRSGARIRHHARRRGTRSSAPWETWASMKAERIWQPVQYDDGPVDALARELGITAVTARLLCIRGLGTPDGARRFLRPRLEDLHDPFALADMSPAIDRIMTAITARQRIAIHGDYDVDGVTSTVILRRALELLGADVVHFIPERLRDGYGLQPATIERLHGDGARLIISVDCGIRADEAAIRARDLGMDLIITDHHEPDVTLPRAL